MRAGLLKYNNPPRQLSLIRLGVVLFLLASITSMSAFNIAGIGSAYAQNGPGTGFFQPPNTGNGGGTPSPNVPEVCPTQGSFEYWVGCAIGITIGSGFGPQQGASHRDSGLTRPDPTLNYQQPTQEYACQFYQDASQSACDTSQQLVIDFLQGFDLGYQYGYAYGYMSGYFLDGVFTSQTQPGLQQQQQQQFPTQPGQQQQLIQPQ